METNNNVQCLVKPIGYSETTGLEIYGSYTSSSGFNYQIGIREIADLRIMEQIAEGVAATFLCGIIIYSKTDNILLDNITVPRHTPYTRTKVVELVKKSLFELLESSITKEGLSLEREAISRQIDEILDNCYFSHSRVAIIDWAKKIGLLNN